MENLGFGDFIFRDKKGNILDKASYLAEFEENFNISQKKALSITPIKITFQHG